jgi:hypothetical protein
MSCARELQSEVRPPPSVAAVELLLESINVESTKAVQCITMGSDEATYDSLQGSHAMLRIITSTFSNRGGQLLTDIRRSAS